MMKVLDLAQFQEWCRTRTRGFAPQQFDAVRAILDRVRRDGDAALVELSRQYDRVELTPAQLRLDPALWSALPPLAPELLDAITLSITRVREFHRRQREASWLVPLDGVSVGQRLTPIDRVGIYVPGGTAPLLSTLIMAAVPAQVAGVPEIVIATPPKPSGKPDPGILAVLHLLGLTEVYQLGGAQAIAALAYGTAAVKRVDKIVGPGRDYVALAKQLVFGAVGIDMVAGPSELMIITDGTANPAWLAADLLSQAEHDPQARAVCVATDRKTLDAIAAELERQTALIPRHEIAKQALAASPFVLVADLAAAAAAANAMAPEHLELAVAAPNQLVGQIRHAGAIFLGSATCEALGDYVAGPNHTLPTGGTARFSSPLGWYDFVKRSSIIGATAGKELIELSKAAAILARAEGLEAHARSAEARHDGR